jgi:hypothetical protein
MKRKIYRYILNLMINDKSLQLTGKERSMLGNLLKIKCTKEWNGRVKRFRY